MKLMMQGQQRLLPSTLLLQIPWLRKQTQRLFHQDKVGFQRSPIRMNVKPAHRHDQISYGAPQIRIDRPLGHHPIFLLAPKYLFLKFTLNAIFRRVAVAAETHTRQERSILPTILAGLVIALATIAEA